MIKRIFPILSILFLCFLFIITDSSSLNIDAEKDIFLDAKTVDLFRPLSKESINELKLESNNFLSVFVNDSKEIVLSEKKANEMVPIASLSKLMTAVVALDNYNLDDIIRISASAVSVLGTAGGLKVNEEISVEDLLYITLIESSNDGAEAFAEKMGKNTFIFKMNEKASQLGMKNTRFVDPTGLDYLGENNVSTSNDLKKLVINISKEYPLITEILSLPEKELTSKSGVFHKIKNTNILLKEKDAYLWGKTGYTVRANECFIFILKNFSVNDEKGYVINIITGSDDRFKEARKLEEWLEEAFIW